MDKVYETSDMDDILSTAEGLYWEIFARTMACELVRRVLVYGAGADRTINSSDTEAAHYEWYRINPNALDVYNLIYKPSEFWNSLENGEFLTDEDPLVEILGQIQDYSPDLYTYVVSKIKEYDYPVVKLGLIGAAAFKELVDEQITTTPKKVKTQYKPESWIDNIDGNHLLDAPDEVITDDETLEGDEVLEPGFDEIDDGEFQDITGGLDISNIDNDF